MEGNLHDPFSDPVHLYICLPICPFLVFFFNHRCVHLSISSVAIPPSIDLLVSFPDFHCLSSFPLGRLTCSGWIISTFSLSNERFLTLSIIDSIHFSSSPLYLSFPAFMNFSSFCSNFTKIDVILFFFFRSATVLWTGYRVNSKRCGPSVSPRDSA